MVGVLGFLRMGTTGFAAQAAGRDDGGALRLILAQGLGMACLLYTSLGSRRTPLPRVTAPPFPFRPPRRKCCRRAFDACHPGPQRCSAASTYPICILYTSRQRPATSRR